MKKQNKCSKKHIDKRMIVPFCVCVALLAVLAVAIVWSLLTDVEQIAESYADAMLKNDADAVYAMYTPDAISYLLRETDMTEKEIKQNLRHKMSLWLSGSVINETGTVTSVDASLVSKEDVPRETVAELEDNFGVNAQNAKCLTVAYRAEGKKGSKDGEMTVYAVKIGGRWYLYDLQMLLG